MLKRINSFFDGIVELMAVIGRLLMVLMAILVGVDIVALSFFDTSYAWIFEVTEYLLLFITFLGVTYVLRNDEHIKLDLVLNKLNEKQRTLFEIISSFFGMIISLIISITGFVVTLNLYEREIVIESVLEIPRYLITGIIPISFIFVTIQFLKILIQKVNKIRE